MAGAIDGDVEAAYRGPVTTSRTMTSPSWPAVTRSRPSADRSNAVRTPRCGFATRDTICSEATSTMSTSLSHRTARRAPVPSNRSARQGPTGNDADSDPLPARRAIATATAAARSPMAAERGEHVAVGREREVDDSLPVVAQ